MPLRSKTKPLPAGRAKRRLPPIPVPSKAKALPAVRSAQTPKQADVLGSTPLPIRITLVQNEYLMAKRERTGVPIQELVRRAIDHMIATVDIAAVPERR